MSKKIIAGVRSVYTFENLSEEAKEKARDWFRAQHDDPMLQSHMINLLGERLEEAGFKVNQYGGQDLDVRYSLSYCQGDGFSFLGDLERGGKRYKVTQSGRYVHEMTMDAVEITEEGEEKEAPEVLEELRKIAREMAQAGYKEIEYQNSAEYIDESMEANGYTFTKEGKRLDAEESEKHAPINCPLCFAETEYREHKGTHIWSCSECPFLALEFVHDTDLENLRESIR